MPQSNSQPILAIDPGLRDLGYAVVKGRKLLVAGVLPLRHVPRARKLGVSEEAILGLIRGYRPRALVWEQIPKRPLDALGGLPGLGRRLRRLARRTRLPAATYSARSVRHTVIGNGWAGKRETAERITTRFPEL